MSLKRVLYVLISIAILAVVIGAAIARSSDLAAVSVQAGRPTWANTLVQDYEAKHGAVDQETEQLILAGVNASCGDLVAGNDLPDVWQMNVDNGMSSDMSATTIELAVQYYCPQYRQLLNRKEES